MRRRTVSVDPARVWKLLDLVEDYVRRGERGRHPDPPRALRPWAAVTRQPGGAASVAPSAAPVPDVQERTRRLDALSAKVHGCTRCALHQSRIRAVPGTGVIDPLVMVIGEGPGAEEDRRGLPFVGRAGEYLDKWLAAIDLARDRNVYIGNIVKCRPPGNRDPHPAESEACLPYLREQLELVRPRAILTVGRIATGILLGTPAGIGSLRGRTFFCNGIPLVPTYHPAAVLRDQSLRKPVWDDLKRLATIITTESGAAEESQPE